MKKVTLTGFTLVELLVVISIIAVLAGMALFGYRYAHYCSMVARARAEIVAISTACETYKVEHGNYPMATGTTNMLNACNSFDPTQPAYQNSSFYLYTCLSGDLTGSGSATNTVYFTFKPSQLNLQNNSAPMGPGNQVQYIVDPFGYSYGYSTIQLGYYLSGATPPANTGYMSTYDLWSTAGKTTQSGTASWVANWNNN